MIKINVTNDCEKVKTIDLVVFSASLAFGCCIGVVCSYLAFEVITFRTESINSVEKKYLLCVIDHSVVEDCFDFDWKHHFYGEMK